MSTPLPEARPGVLAVGGFAQANRQKRRWDAVLTCEDPRERQRLRLEDRPQRVLAFEDCDDESLGYAVATSDQLQAGLAFLRENREGSLLVHCMHGAAPVPMADRWPKLENRAPVFDRRSPVQAMIEGGIPRMLETRQYIDALRGGL